MKIRPAETNDLSKALPVAETIAAMKARAEAAEAALKQAMERITDLEEQIDDARDHFREYNQ